MDRPFFKWLKEGTELNNQESPKIYLISSPCGVGKSTLAKNLVQSVSDSVIVEGDYFLHRIDESLADITWEEKLHIMWKNILSTTLNYLQHGMNVVIDIVVEEELEWFCRYFEHSPIRIYYIVLMAEGDVLRKRLTKRGDTYLIDRALFLVKKLGSDPINQKFLLDTTNIDSKDVLNKVLSRDDFVVNCSIISQLKINTSQD